MRAPLKEGEPVFLLIAWTAAGPNGAGEVEVEAFLCRRHRQEVADGCSRARGCGRRGESCDLCEGREPRTVPR
jgi:hypothetical protein